MGVLLTIALSLGILAHAAVMPIFGIWIFFGGPEKRWQTSLATLATMAGIFTYLIALTDDPSVAYIALGIMRGLFEVQRGVFLRVFPGPTMIVFGLVVVANSLGHYTYNLALPPVIVSYVASILCYFVALFVLYLLRRMQGKKSAFSLGVAFAYMISVLILFALSPAFFDVISHSVEFFIYVLLDIGLLIVPAFWHGLAFFYRDAEVLPFDYISTHQGLETETREILSGQPGPEEAFRDQYYHDGGLPVEDLPPDEMDLTGWRTPKSIEQF